MRCAHETLPFGENGVANGKGGGSPGLHNRAGGLAEAGRKAGDTLAMREGSALSPSSSITADTSPAA